MSDHRSRRPPRPTKFPRSFSLLEIKQENADSSKPTARHSLRTHSARFGSRPLQYEHGRGHSNRRGHKFADPLSTVTDESSDSFVSTEEYHHDASSASSSSSFSRTKTKSLTSHIKSPSNLGLYERTRTPRSPPALHEEESATEESDNGISTKYFYKQTTENLIRRLRSGSANVLIPHVEFEGRDTATCFRGQQLVTWLVEKRDFEHRRYATVFLNQLMQANTIRSLMPKVDVFEDADMLYKFNTDVAARKRVNSSHNTDESGKGSSADDFTDRDVDNFDSFDLVKSIAQDSPEKFAAVLERVADEADENNNDDQHNHAHKHNQNHTHNHTHNHPHRHTHKHDVHLQQLLPASLYHAVKLKASNVVRYLLEQRGVDVDCRNKSGDTPLHRAAYHGDTRMVNLLLEHQADVNAVCASNGETPIFRAARRLKNIGCAILLLEHGAKILVSNKKARRPVDMLLDLQETQQRLCAAVAKSFVSLTGGLEQMLSLQRLAKNDENDATLISSLKHPEAAAFIATLCAHNATISEAWCDVLQQLFSKGVRSQRSAHSGMLASLVTFCACEGALGDLSLHILARLATGNLQLNEQDCLKQLSVVDLLPLASRLSFDTAHLKQTHAIARVLGLVTMFTRAQLNLGTAAAVKSMMHVCCQLAQLHAHAQAQDRTRTPEPLEDVPEERVQQQESLEGFDDDTDNETDTDTDCNDNNTHTTTDTYATNTNTYATNTSTNTTTTTQNNTTTNNTNTNNSTTNNINTANNNNNNNNHTNNAKRINNNNKINNNKINNNDNNTESSSYEADDDRTMLLQRTVTWIMRGLANIAKRSETHHVWNQLHGVPTLTPLLSFPTTTVQVLCARIFVFLGHFNTHGIDILDAHDDTSNSQVELLKVDTQSTVSEKRGGAWDNSNNTKKEEEVVWAQIKGASLEKVVTVLVHESTAEICRLFFMVYQTYCQPTALFRLLTSNVRLPVGAGAGVGVGVGVDVMPPIHQRVIEVLKIWIKAKPSDFFESPMLQQDLKNLLQFLGERGGVYSMAAAQLLDMSVSKTKQTTMMVAAISDYSRAQHQRLYTNAKQKILSGELPTTKVLAVTLAAAQLYIEDLEQQSQNATRQPNTKLKNVFPPGFAKGKDTEELVAIEYERICGLSMRDAKHLYLHVCSLLAFDYFPVKQVLEDKNKRWPRLFGVGADRILVLHEKTKDIIVDIHITHLKRWRLQLLQVKGKRHLEEVALGAKGGIVFLVFELETSSLYFTAEKSLLLQISELVLMRVKEISFNTNTSATTTTTTSTTTNTPPSPPSCFPTAPTMSSNQGGQLHAKPKTLAMLNKQQFLCHCPETPLLDELQLRDLTVFKLLDCPIEFARQLTVLEHSYFKMIESQDILDRVFNPNSAEKSGCDKFIALFNTINQWIVTMILEQKDIPSRCYVLNCFVIVAAECLNLNNFNGLMEVVTALNATPVRRLTTTWRTMDDDVMSRFRQLDNLMTASDNFAACRTAMAAAIVNPPVVPYFGILLKDLTFLHQGNPNYLAAGLFNVSKWHHVISLIKNMELQQKHIYNILIIPEAQQCLLAIQPRSADWIDERSRIIVASEG